jgi:hypothetical protein
METVAKFYDPQIFQNMADHFTSESSAEFSKPTGKNSRNGRFTVSVQISRSRPVQSGALCP